MYDGGPVSQWFVGGVSETVITLSRIRVTETGDRSEYDIENYY